MPAGDTAQDRRATLSDGSVLVYRRPGGILLSEIEEAGIDLLRAEIAKKREGMSAAELQQADEEQEQRDRTRPERIDAEQARLEALSEPERRAAEKRRHFRELNHSLLVYHCASAWTYADGDPVVSLTAGSAGADDALKALRDLPAADLREAARVILDSHYERRKQARKNSSTTSAP